MQKTKHPSFSEERRIQIDSQALSHLFSCQTSFFYAGRQIIRIRRLHWQNWHHKIELYHCLLQLTYSYRWPAERSRLWGSQFGLQSSLRSSLACRNRRLLIFNLQSFLPLGELDRGKKKTLMTAEWLVVALLYLQCCNTAAAPNNQIWSWFKSLFSQCLACSLSCSVTPEIVPTGPV